MHQNVNRRTASAATAPSTRLSKTEEGLAAAGRLHRLLSVICGGSVDSANANSACTPATPVAGSFRACRCSEHVPKTTINNAESRGSSAPGLPPPQCPIVPADFGPVPGGANATVVGPAWADTPQRLLALGFEQLALGLAGLLLHSGADRDALHLESRIGHDIGMQATNQHPIRTATKTVVSHGVRRNDIRKVRNGPKIMSKLPHVV